MSNTLYERYQQAKIDHPGKYARDLAAILGVSEAELTPASATTPAACRPTRAPC